MCDSGDNFNKKLEKHSNNDIDKENKPKNRRERTRKEQFDLIVKFYEKNNEELLHDDIFIELWDELVVNLNSIGPPSHTNIEWKRVWTEHKCNKKRKRLDAVAEGDFVILFFRRASVQHTWFSGLSKTPVNKVFMKEQTEPLQVTAQNFILADVDEILFTKQPSAGPLTAAFVENLSIPFDLQDEYSEQESVFMLDNLNELLMCSDVSSFSNQLTDAVNSPLHYIKPSHLNNGSDNQSGSFSEPQNQSNPIANKLSEIVKKLDVLIDLKIESNNLMKELIKNTNNLH